MKNTSADSFGLPWFIKEPNPEIYLGNNYLTLDFETSNLEKGSPLNLHNRLLLACWNFRGKQLSKWGDENNQRELLTDIAKADFIVAHNAKFELGWLRRCGVDLRSILVYDTMLAEWVLLGNQKEKGLSLNASTTRRGLKGKLDLVGDLIHLGVNPENIPKHWLEEYCHVDVDITEQLFLKQRSLLAERKQLHIVYQRGLVAACLADIEPHGLCLDKERVLKEYERVSKEFAETNGKLEAYGDINWRSRKQVGELLYDKLGFDEPRDRRGNVQRTATGNRATDKAAISGLSASSDAQSEFKELFKKVANLNAKLTKNLEFFKGVCEKHDGIFYGIFNQGTTATHRLSSSGRPILLPKQTKKGTQESPKGVQLHNLPREYKSLFKAKRDGWLIIEGDSAQLEFRVAAELGKDKVAIQEIKDKIDIHTNTAKVFLKDGTQPEFKGLTLKEARQPAKNQTFKPLFGGTGITKAEKEYCKFFQSKYKEIYAEQESWTWEVLKSGQGELITDYGMRFYWPGTSINKWNRIDNKTSIYDYPVQGFATGEIIPLALVMFWHRTKHLKLELVNTVHDSIISEVHPDDQEEAKSILKECLTTEIYKLLKELYDYHFKEVPLGYGIKVGEHWSEGQEEQGQVGYD